MTLCTCCIGLITYIKDNFMMVSVTIFLRSCRGFFRVFIQATSISFLVILHPEDKMAYVGYMESAMNIGSGIGPVIGSILYNLVGYLYMFLILGLAILVFVPLLKLSVPANIDNEDETTMLNSHQNSS